MTVVGVREEVGRGKRCPEIGVRDSDRTHLFLGFRVTLPKHVAWRPVETGRLCGIRARGIWPRVTQHSHLCPEDLCSRELVGVILSCDLRPR